MEHSLISKVVIIFLESKRNLSSKNSKTNLEPLGTGGTGKYPPSSPNNFHSHLYALFSFLINEFYLL